jgi:hypothetical protein
MGNTFSTGRATEERRGYASDKVGILQKKRIEQMETTAVPMSLDSGSGDLMQRVRMQQRSSSV